MARVAQPVPLLSLFMSLPKKIEHILFFSVLNTILNSTIGVYIPLYLLDTFGTLRVPLFFLGLEYGLFYMPCTTITTRLIERLGIERTQALSLFLNTGGLLLLSNPTIPRLVASALVFSLAVTTYWLPYHLAFARYGKKREVTREYGIINVAITIVGIALPLLGGVFITLQGYKAFLETMSIGVLAMAVIAAIKTGTREKTGFPTRHKRATQRFWPLFLVEGASHSAWFGVSLVAYSILGSLVAYGGIKSGMALIAAAITLWASKRVDHLHDYSLAALGYSIRGVLFSLFLAFPRPETAALVLLVLGALAPISDVPFSGFLYGTAKSLGSGLVLSRARALGVSRFVFLSLLALLPWNGILLASTLFVIALSLVYHYYTRGEPLPENMGSILRRHKKPA